MISLGGCSHEAWRRLAPPGIIKYEDLAGDQPTNTEIQAQIDQRTESGNARYPKISDTPGKTDRPTAPPNEEVAAEISALSTQRDEILEKVDDDRAAVAADRDTLGGLDAERDDLAARLEQDEAAAQRERRNNN